MPLSIPKHLGDLIPRGRGNREIISAAPFLEAAHGVVSTIDRIQIEMGWRIERIVTRNSRSVIFSNARRARLDRDT